MTIGYAGPATAQGMVGSCVMPDATSQTTFSYLIVRGLSLLEPFHFGEEHGLLRRFPVLFALSFSFLFSVTIDWGGIGCRMRDKKLFRRFWGFFFGL